MTQFMKKTAIAALLSATSLSAAQAATPLGDVTVESRTAGIEGAASFLFFPNITEDLENAIEARLPMTGMEKDAQIEVQVIELLLDGDTIAPDSTEFNEMQITVMYSHPDNAFPSEIYPARVSATEVSVPVPAGFKVVDATAPDFYRVLMAGAADQVVKLLPEEIEVTPYN
ncbi:hypothetical protein [uncultured Tateyamaria sp.]|uniref:hypothetical protein n=1 Tax=uncultured Tateyamaria sp. TaxID=455651 RepID=UPI00262E6551|nr:hypothetical protein [uncultured Tateyamaria sp.]